MVRAETPLRADENGVEIDVVVVPRASRSRVVGLLGDRVKVQVAAPPVDGAANAELACTLARALDVPKGAVCIMRGHSSKRKTVRVAGLDLANARALLGLAGPTAALTGWIAATGVLALLGGCQPITTEIDLRVVLPADSNDLEATNNVTIVISPDGVTQTIGTVGVEFVFSAELEPDDSVRRLSVYLARNEDLLAWGRTPGFTFDAARGGAAVFVARPERLSTFPLGFAPDDPDLRAAYAHGRGLVAVGGDGSTTFVDALTLDVLRAATLVRPPAPEDGALVGDALGGVQRVAWNEGIVSHRFDPGTNTWIERSLGGAGAVGSREGAAHLVDTPGEQLFLYGGGNRTDVVAVSLLPTGGGTAVQRVEGIALDDPRRGATAMPIVRDDGLETVLLFGSDDPTRPIVYLVEHGEALGPEAAWLGGRCLQLDHGGAGATLRVLCAGGLRDGAPTADGLLVTMPSVGTDDSPTTQLLPDLLGAPMPDPRWIGTDDAAYAQGAGRLLRIERTDLEVSQEQEAARGSGGSTVRLPGGATFLVGGVDADEAPVSTWQVFMPTP
jgi:uncharacterized protein